jgi:2-ketoarginine methyltransferase
MVARESDLIEAVQPIRGLALATSLQHFFARGIYDLLASSSAPLALGEIAARLEFRQDRLHGLLRFLRNEDFLDQSEAGFQLSPKARRWAEFRPWYDMMVGGYAMTFMAMGDALALGSAPAPRAGDCVGRGSCGISQHDSIPIVRRLLAQLPVAPELVLDMGCGSATYLVEMCRMYSDCRAIGVEPDAGACVAARAHVSEMQLESRIEIVQADALQYVLRMPTAPDVVLFGFVLHEVLGQSGEQTVVELLRTVMSLKPKQHLIVIDIDYRIDEAGVMKHKLAEGYYNAYFLLHPFTSQRLESQAYWDGLFRQAGLEIRAKYTTDPYTDSANIALGWLLRRA